MNHYINVEINNGIYSKQIKEFAQEFGLEKKVLRKVFEDENYKIKYKIKMGRLDETDSYFVTIIDIYSINPEKARFIYNNLEKLYKKVRDKNGEDGAGIRVYRSFTLEEKLKWQTKNLTQIIKKKRKKF